MESKIYYELGLTEEERVIMFLKKKGFKEITPDMPEWKDMSKEPICPYSDTDA